MTEDEDAVCGAGFTRAEAQFENVAVTSLLVALDSCIEGPRVIGSQAHAGIYGGFIVGWGLDEDESFGQVENLRLLAACSGEQRTHREGLCTCRGSFTRQIRHSDNFAYPFRRIYAVCL